MNIAMMWFDNDPKVDLATKIERAAAHHQKKYGERPDLCYLHPTLLPVSDVDGEFAINGIEVKSSTAIMPNYLWIGVKLKKS